MKLLVPLLLSVAVAAAQQRVVVDGDSLSSICCPTYPAWPTLLTNFDEVTDNAISGGAVLDFPGNPHVISDDYISDDYPRSPVVVGSNSFFVLDGSHNDIYANRHSADEIFDSNSNLLMESRSHGFIAVGCTVAPSKLISDSGSETNRLQFNLEMRAASNVWQILFDWDAVLPHDTSDTNWYVDGTHPGTNAVAALAAEFQRLANNYVIGKLCISRQSPGVRVSWDGYERLQFASNCDGPYLDTESLIGPITNSCGGSSGFYRLKLQP